MQELGRAERAEGVGKILLSVGLGGAALLQEGIPAPHSWNRNHPGTENSVVRHKLGTE